MYRSSSTYTSFRRVTLGALAAATVLALSPSLAHAGSCPADKMGVDVRQADATPAKGVSDNVLTMIELAKEPIAIQGREFRLRRLEIQPGGVVPWHSHA